MIGKIGLGVLGTTVLAGVFVAHQGVVRVRVVEKTEGGDRINLYVPAVFFPVAVQLAPEDKIREALEQAKELLPAVRIASQELRRLPDTQLVEVRDGEEHVRIRTMDGELVIEVQSDREDVHISIPMKTIEKVVQELQERGSTL